MPPTNRSLEMLRSRKLDVANALVNGGCIADLARLWRISRPRAHEWCASHLSIDDRRTLAENGRASAAERKREFDLGKRLEMIALCKANGWPLEKIALAIGVTYTSLWRLLELHAPHGLTEALEDYREEEAA